MITTFYPPYNFGGDGVFVQRLSNELARRGHRSRSFTASMRTGSRLHRRGALPRSPRRHRARAEEPMGPASPLLTQQTGLPLLKGKRIRRILDTGFDVIHLPQHLAGGWAGRPGARERGQALHDARLLAGLPDACALPNNKSPARGRRVVSPAPSRTGGRHRPGGIRACWRTRFDHVDALIAPSLTSQRKHEQLGIAGGSSIFRTSCLPRRTASRAVSPGRRATDFPVHPVRRSSGAGERAPHASFPRSSAGMMSSSGSSGPAARSGVFATLAAGSRTSGSSASDPGASSRGCIATRSQSSIRP